MGQLTHMPVRLPVVRQEWSTITFLHWSCEPAEIARRLPAGLRPHLFDGRAWLSVTPFEMRGARPVGLPPVPGWSTFPEVNLRTYVQDAKGRDGLWFFTLDAPRRSLERTLHPLLGVPYRYRPARIVRADGVVRYWFGGTHDHHLEVTVGEAIKNPGELDVFLTARWTAFTQRLGRLLRFPVDHPPWPLYAATVTGSMVGAARDFGFEVSDDEPLVHHSPGVRVKFATPRLSQTARKWPPH